MGNNQQDKGTKFITIARKMVDNISNFHCLNG